MLRDGLLRDGHHAHRRRAGDVPRRRVVATGGRGAARCWPTLAGHPYTTEVGAFNLELNLDPQDCSPALLRADAPPARRDARPRARRGRRRRAADRAVRHAADDPQARPRRSTTWCQNPRYLALNDALDGLRGEALRAAHQGHRRAARAPGLGDGRSVQRQLPGPPPGDAGRVRQRLQLRPGARRPDAGVRDELARCCSASGCGPRPGSRCSSRRSTPAGRATTARAHGPGELRRRAGSRRRSPTCTRRTSPGSGRCWRPTTTSIRSPSSMPGGSRSSTALRLHTGTVWRWNRGVLRHLAERRTAPSRTCASRTGSCRQVRARPTRSPTPRCGSA